MTDIQQGPAVDAAAGGESRLKQFYEREYERDFAIAPVPRDDDFLYALVIAQVRPYLRPGLRVLDLGCNTGALSFYMARAGCQVVAVDLAENAIAAARAGAARHGITNVDFRCMDFMRDWTTPAAFDLVLCSHVIEHVPDDNAFLRKIGFATAPGGAVVVLTPTVHSSLYRVSKAITGRYRHDEDVGHLRRYTRERAAAVTAQGGFAVERTVFLDGLLRDWFILCRPLRVFNQLWARRYVRSAFNAVDALTAPVLFPAAIAVHGRRLRA